MNNCLGSPLVWVALVPLSRERDRTLRVQSSEFRVQSRPFTHTTELLHDTRTIPSECALCWRSPSHRGEPKERRTPHLPPFTFVGMDCFGPIAVKRGRSGIKRYGVIFPRLTTRAQKSPVHSTLTPVSMLSGGSQVDRGQVKQTRSDNGTNPTSADRELRNAIQEWNQSPELQAFLQQKGTGWIYRPPAAAHFHR